MAFYSAPYVGISSRPKVRVAPAAIIEMEAELLIPKNYLEFLKERGFKAEEEESRPGWYCVQLKSCLDHRAFIALLTSQLTSPISDEDKSDEEEEEDGEHLDPMDRDASDGEIEDFKRKGTKTKRVYQVDEEEPEMKKMKED